MGGVSGANRQRQISNSQGLCVLDLRIEAVHLKNHSSEEVRSL